MNKETQTLKDKIIDAIKQFKLDTGIEKVDIETWTRYEMSINNTIIPTKTEVLIKIS